MRTRKKVHIVGTHGVPAKYGGFETLADFLCQYLGADFDITVYCNASKYPEREHEYFGAKLRYVKLGASGFQGIIYDLLTYCHAILRADIILYLSPVGSGFMTPLKYLAGRKVIVNHGGLNEWEREKLSAVQKVWAKFNHFIASKFSDVNIADNTLYQKSLKESFGADSVVIRYGGDHVTKIIATESNLSEKYAFVSGKFAVSVSRAQLDNNIHIVLEAFESFNEYKVVVVSNWDVSAYGKELKRKYSDHPNMILLDAIYDKQELDYIRGNATLYIHSHSRCGTAPSLVEAMCLGSAVVSFDVPTNRETTLNKAFYFSDSYSLVDVLQNLSENEIEVNKKEMGAIAHEKYRWEKVTDEYRQLFNGVLKVGHSKLMDYSGRTEAEVRDAIS